MLANISIRTRVMAAFGLVLALTLLLGVLSLTRLNSVADSGLVIGTNALPSIKEIEVIYAASLRTRVNQYQHVLSQTDKEKDYIEQRISGALKELAESRTQYEKLISSAEEQATYDQMTAKWTEYLSNWKNIHSLSRQNKTADANTLMREQQTPLFYKIQDDVSNTNLR